MAEAGGLVSPVFHLGGYHQVKTPTSCQSILDPFNSILGFSKISNIPT